MADDRPGTSASDRAPTLLPVVAAALVDGEGRVLLQRRPPGKQMADLWEFPGGKIEPGESPEAALARELAEELAITVDPATAIPLTFASAALGQRHLLLLLYLIRDWQGEPRPLEASALAWVLPQDMHALAMPPADVPLVAMLERLL
ncbi:8-oxo-dGTP diphosphatase [Sphingomonas insulae]|uniref:(deoxy)nucleoside triphosphate pyrophosphohydrolase n=1 Tax=Sphingomonas insulae TaxID=424800 RepID=UPI0013D51694|nr:(deoxy)nucleoside triphosphate pyrophosphohydrolase [Sphingomonas insulae]NIJ29222.1 8-oxo-dGTP diphosphatase [Sphingomonas insulae]